MPVEELVGPHTVAAQMINFPERRRLQVLILADHGRRAVGLRAHQPTRPIVSLKKPWHVPHAPTRRRARGSANGGRPGVADERDQGGRRPRSIARSAGATRPQGSPRAGAARPGPGRDRERVSHAASGRRDRHHRVNPRPRRVSLIRSLPWICAWHWVQSAYHAARSAPLSGRPAGD